MKGRACLVAMQLVAFLALFCTLPPPALAQQWTATQGDVLSIDLPSDTRHLKVRAFGRTWPWKRLDGNHIRTWIGIDLATKPGEHTILLRNDAGEQRHRVDVKAGSFRISRITVAKKMAEFSAADLRRIRADQAAIKHTYEMGVDAHPDIRIAVEPVEGVISTPFGARRYVNGEPRSPHSGLDIAAPEGTPIITPLAGRVLLAQSMFLNGNTVVIGCGNGLVMVYSHLKALRLKQGDWLQAGERIGEIGMTGRATGPHLHWGVRFRQARINPLTLLAAHDITGDTPASRQSTAMPEPEGKP